jgi:NAD dependent epimerase/dehydratase family
LTTHPDFQITALVRNSTSGSKIASHYSKIHLVYGDLDSYDSIRDEAAKADIVVHPANCDHEGSANAIVEGLTKGHTKEKPGYFLHNSGTGILEVDDLVRGTYGTSATKVYDDWDGIGTVTSLPDQAWHRNVDKIVLAAPSESNGAIKTAIICPPTIYGPGRGPGNQTSDQWPRMVAATLQRGKGFYVGEGENKWTHVHVHDLSALYIALIDAAVAEISRHSTNKNLWNENGYYFAENGEFVWGEIARKIAAECQKQGLVQSKECESVSKEQADGITAAGSAKWGMNSRCRAIRGRKLLGWTPKGNSPEGELPGLVREQAVKLGMVKAHAEQAAGE